MKTMVDDAQNLEINQEVIIESIDDVKVFTALADYSRFQDEKTYKKASQAVRNHSEFRQWWGTAFKNISVRYTDKIEKAKKDFEILISGYIHRYNRLFIGREEVFDKFHTKMVKEEIKIFKNTLENVTRVIKGENVDEIFNDETTIARVRDSFKTSSK